jgi:peptide/nickel transport system permease protein
MGGYIFSRLVQGFFTILVLVSIVFALSRLLGNPADLMLPPDASLQDRTDLIRHLGLDRPLYIQYGEFIKGVFTGDLGNSLVYKRPVMELFLERLPNSFALGMVALVFALSVGVVLGVVSGTNRGTFIDHIASGIAVFGISAPAFWTGLMLMLLFAVQLQILPVARMEGPASFVLPALTISFAVLAGTTRLVRSSMIGAMDSEFVSLARIKGVSEGAIVWKHCLRNAALPLFTFAGAHILDFLTGAVVVETIFAWPGVGRFITQGVTARDYPVVEGTLLIVGTGIVLANLVVDIMYGYIDPRIRIAGDDS